MCVKVLLESGLSLVGWVLPTLRFALSQITVSGHCFIYNLDMTNELIIPQLTAPVKF